MKKVLLFGATGNLGKEIAKELKAQGYEFTAVVRNTDKAAELNSLTTNCIVADVTNRAAIKDICKGFDVVISSLGKSVSLNDKSKPGFYDIDFKANNSILEEAKKSGVKKFVYVSALGAENYLHLNYFKVHHDFSEALIQSGINYSIIKPPAIFCAFIDVIAMAKKGQLMHIGAGDKKTNPIYEGDLAKVCVDSINHTNKIVEAGGKKVYTRKELNQIIQEAVKPGKKIGTMPLFMLKMGLPMLKLANKNTYDKFAFYTEVLLHDVIAPQIGEMKFEEYVKLKTKA
jgi:uncharacterized protein YbjT (DUF2867 family)